MKSTLDLEPETRFHAGRGVSLRLMKGAESMNKLDTVCQQYLDCCTGKPKQHVCFKARVERIVWMFIKMGISPEKATRIVALALMSNDK